MKVETVTYDCSQPDGQWFTVVWYPENDHEYAVAADRLRPGDRIDTSLAGPLFVLGAPGTVTDKFGDAVAQQGR